MSEGTVLCTRVGATVHLTFDRPQARNAMTWAMYETLYAHCEALNADDRVRCVVLRGAGGKAFVAGTDIGQFLEFDGARDGIDYEHRGERFIAAVERLRMPTIAVIEGWAMGGGLAIATVCDLRIATPDARFGAPIARTLGNCLSQRNYARLVAGFGVSRVKRMLMLAEPIGAAEARACGFLAEVVDPSALDARIAELTGLVGGHAPLSMRAGKESLRRLLHGDLSDDEDLIASCYGSQDFSEGVKAFMEKRPARWQGR